MRAWNISVRRRVKNMNEVKLFQLCTKASEFDGEFKWQAAGMSYMICLSDNSFVMIDGGYEEDAEPLISKMRELSGESVPCVRLWIITHPHEDHYRALFHVATNDRLRSSVDIERLCYSIPKDGKLPGSGYSVERELNEIERIRENLGCPVLLPYTGDVVDFENVKIRFLSTHNDFDTLNDPNELSLVFRVNGPRRSVVFTGDAYACVTQRVCFDFWDELKSDFCQVAHHGLNGGSADFYAKVDAKTVLIPISKSGEAYMNKQKCFWPRFFAEKNAEIVVRACDGDAEFLM